MIDEKGPLAERAKRLGKETTALSNNSQNQKSNTKEKKKNKTKQKTKSQPVVIVDSSNSFLCFFSCVCPSYSCGPFRTLLSLLSFLFSFGLSSVFHIVYILVRLCLNK
jgi:hypothetical protein